MRMSVCRVLIIGVFVASGMAGSARDASAQYRPPSGPVIGEDYHIEASLGWWNADPSLVVNSTALGIIGSDVDLVDDLGIVKKRLRQFDVTLRPGRKHKFRFEYLPISYDADAVLRRSFIFNGQRYNIGLPVQTTAGFETYRYGYEYDFVSMKRGYAGVMLDLKYTNVDVDLNSPVGHEFTSAAAPIPTIGFTGRGYVAPTVSVTAEFSFMRVPEKFRNTFDGTYTDFNLYGTFNVNRYVGGQVGFRTIDLFYDADNDTGTLKFKGLYVGGVVRY